METFHLEAKKKLVSIPLSQELLRCRNEVGKLIPVAAFIHLKLCFMQQHFHPSFFSPTASVADSFHNMTLLSFQREGKNDTEVHLGSCRSKRFSSWK